MLILGTNLTQDRIVRLATLVPGAVLRAVTVDPAPGGKPVNVARAARALGGRPTLVANCPGGRGCAARRPAVALRAGPALVKPNLAEAESVLRALAGPVRPG